MNSGAEWLLAALIGVALVFGAQWIRVFLLIRGTRLSPAEGPDDDTLAAIPLRDFERAAVDELESWGFVRFRETFDRFGWEPIRTVFFAHRDLPHFARLQLRGTPAIGLPVMFVSFTVDGSPVATVNRIGWMAALGCDSLNVVDAKVDSVEAQWALHCTRAAKAHALEPVEAADRVDRAIADERAQSLSTGRWVRGPRFVHASFRSAWRGTAALMAERRLLMRPLQSAATSGTHAVSFLIATLQQQARLQLLQRTERSIKLALFAASLGIAWMLWGLLFDWRTAVELIAVVLVHELGHAIAMQAFGWTNLHVFFVPLMGAVATGGRPGQSSAWKDTVVLLAGPVPGLAVGLAVLASPLFADPQWHSAALLAVSVNAFNLLPLTPLDGGQLMAIALFNRWPYARLAFTMLSAMGILAVGWLLRAPAALFIALVLLLGWRREMRIAAIERQASRADPIGGDIAQVSEAVCQRQPALGLSQRSVLAQLVLRRRQVPQAGIVLGLAIVTGLGALWGFAAPPLARAFAPAPSRVHADARSSAQRAFDAHWHNVRDVKLPDAVAALSADAPRLAPGDARQRDFEWLQTRLLPPAQRAKAVSDWLAGGHGHFVSRWMAANDLVNDQVLAAASRAPMDRVADMQTLVNWSHSLPAGLSDIDVKARLRLAEAVDLAGDEAGAKRMLEEIEGNASRRPDCRCGLREAIEARAWFESSHDRPFEALRVLSGPVARTLGMPEPEDLAIAHAWVFLQAGDRSGGLKQMRSALHADRLDADFAPLPMAAGSGQSDDDEEFELWQAPELAVALHAAGFKDDARRLCRTVAADECASDARREVGDTVPEGPWQARHMRERATLMQALVKGAPKA